MQYVKSQKGGSLGVVEPEAARRACPQRDIKGCGGGDGHETQADRKIELQIVVYVEHRDGLANDGDPAQHDERIDPQMAGCLAKIVLELLRHGIAPPVILRSKTRARGAPQSPLPEPGLGFTKRLERMIVSLFHSFQIKGRHRGWQQGDARGLVERGRGALRCLKARAREGAQFRQRGAKPGRIHGCWNVLGRNLMARQQIERQKALAAGVPSQPAQDLRQTQRDPSVFNRRISFDACARPNTFGAPMQREGVRLAAIGKQSFHRLHWIIVKVCDARVEKRLEVSRVEFVFRDRIEQGVRDWSRPRHARIECPPTSEGAFRPELAGSPSGEHPRFRP